MAATIVIQSAHGGSAGSPGSTSTVTSARMKAADNDTADTNNPLVRPTSGLNYSYEKWLRLYCSVAPSNVVNNFRFHRASGSPSTGITDLYGERSIAEGYEVPVQTNGYAATSMPTSATSLSKNATDFSAATTQYGPWVVLQWSIGPTAVAGTQTALTYRFTYDES